MANVLDQQYNGTIDGDFALRFGAANGVKLGQSFTPAVTGPVGRVSLRLKKVGTPTGNIWVTIETTSSDDPTGTIISQSANVDVSTLTGSYATYNFDFTGGTSITASTVYAIVLQGDYTINGTSYAVWGGTNTGAYAGGELKGYNGTDWNQFGAGADFWFDEYYDLSLIRVPAGGVFLNNLIS